MMSGPIMDGAEQSANADIVQGKRCIGLIAAVVRCAVTDFYVAMDRAKDSGVRNRYEAFLKAQQSDAGLWLFDDIDRPYSYVWCCLHLDFAPDVIRRKLLRRDVEFKWRKSGSGRRKAKTNHPADAGVIA